MNPQEEKEKVLWRQQKHLEIKAGLEQSEKLKQFLENVYPTSREKFISEYAREKVKWLEWGPKYIEWMEGEDLHWVNDASERLKEIQQKKLFDVQCLWRAEKIQLPQVQVSSQFFDWEKDILNCPFIEPVSEAEIDIYIQYLQSGNFEEYHGMFDQWQDYEKIKKAYDNEEESDRTFPEWYDFHNSRTGLSAYLLLPDIRGEKERFYLELWREEMKRKKEAEAKMPAAVAPDPSLQDSRPYLNYTKNGWLTWFVQTFEDKETQAMFDKFGREKPFNDSEKNEWIDNDLRLLGRADRVMPIEGWFDWREPVHKTAARYRSEKIAEALPLAYEQYRMQIDLKIPFPGPDPLRKLLMGDWYREGVLSGRELNGEPRNFNF